MDKWPYDPSHMPTREERLAGSTLCVCPDSYLENGVPVWDCPVHSEKADRRWKAEKVLNDR